MCFNQSEKLPSGGTVILQRTFSCPTGNSPSALAPPLPNKPPVFTDIIWVTICTVAVVFQFVFRLIRRGEGTPPCGNCLIQSAEWILCQPDKTDAQCAPLQYFTWYSIINRPEYRICFLPTIIRKPSTDCKAKILPLSPLRFSLCSYIIILVNERCVVLCPNRTVFWQ